MQWFTASAQTRSKTTRSSRSHSTLSSRCVSDPGGEVAKAFGVLMGNGKFAKRVTFVIGTDGQIAFVGEGGDAMDPTSAAAACAAQ